MDIKIEVQHDTDSAANAKSYTLKTNWTDALEFVSFTEKGQPSKTTKQTPTSYDFVAGEFAHAASM